jgi:competence protein CoiA
MFTAQTKAGNIVCLANVQSKETLMRLRNYEEFICPVCGEPVLLKLGELRMFHFAHKSGYTCHEAYERETITHMEGKFQLYQWLAGQRIPCILEYYDSNIRQRPDILFHYQGKKYALEFQCSSIPETVFIKRTTTYLEHDYTPLWILSNHHLQPNAKGILPLSQFHYLFLRTSASHHSYIPAYCPKTKNFHIVNSIIPYSIKNAFVRHSRYPLQKTVVGDLLEPNASPNYLRYTSWVREIENYSLKWALHSGAGHHVFLQELYKHQLNLFLLPPELGLPLTHSFYITTAPIIWQTYLYLDLIANKNPGDPITIKEVIWRLNKRISTKEIIPRHLPQLERPDPMVPVLEYFQQLIAFGILTRKSATVCQISRKINIPKSNREKEEAKQIFQQKNKQFLI